MSVEALPNLGSDTIITLPCADCSINLESVYNSNSYYSSHWTPNNAINAVPGNYRLLVSTSSGCKDSVVIWLNAKEQSTLFICDKSSVNIQATINGTTYQWMVDDGNGFTNISNSINFQGTNSAILKLTNIPENWYGYKFKCMVDGVSDIEYALKFLSVWNGSQDTNWENSSNWSCGGLPGQNTNVYINSGNVVLNSNQSCRSLKVKPGATVTVTSGYNLTVLY